VVSVSVFSIPESLGAFEVEQSLTDKRDKLPTFGSRPDYMEGMDQGAKKLW